MKYVLFLMMVLFSSQAVALNCEKQPTCEELNYSKEDDPQCAEDGYVLCPFDFSYKKCLQPDCESLGFTQSDKSAWCADIATCKGDKSYTLCQTPCIAWDSDTLSSLAESGKCKVVTIKNDITIPKNESLTLAKNTVIDGGGHTLHTSVSKENIKNYILRNHTGFRNITLEHKAIDMQKGNSIIFAESIETPISFSNVRFYVTSDVDTLEKTSSSKIIARGKCEVSGQFEVNVRAKRYYTPFGDEGKRHFTNADVLLDVESYGHALFATGDVSFENSKAQLITNNSPFANTKSINIKNSDVSVNSEHVFYYNEENLQGSINILENGRLSYEMGETGTFVRQNDVNLQFYLKGTAGNPASLVLNVKEDQKDHANVISSANTMDTVKLNGVSYHPTKEATTKLSEIESSENWKKE